MHKHKYTDRDVGTLVFNVLATLHIIAVKRQPNILYKLRWKFTAAKIELGGGDEQWR